MNIPDGSSQVYFHPALDKRFVSFGWLGDTAIPNGDTQPEVLQALRILADANEVSDNTLGKHRCEICDAFEESSSFHVDLSDDCGISALLPRMVLHYITVHRYKLPNQIEAAAVRNAAQVREPIIDFRTDAFLRSRGYEPISRDEKFIHVRGNDSKDSIADLEFVLQRAVCISLL